MVVLLGHIIYGHQDNGMMVLWIIGVGSVFIVRIIRVLTMRDMPLGRMLFGGCITDNPIPMEPIYTISILTNRMIG